MTKHLAEMKERAEENLRDFGEAQGRAYYQIQYLAVNNLKLIKALEKCRSQRDESNKALFGQYGGSELDECTVTDDAELAAILEGE